MMSNIYRRRGELVRLMFAVGLSESQEQELDLIDAQLDEANKQAGGASLDRLESVVEAYEKLANSVCVAAGLVSNLRCQRSGNPCGTDTYKIGHPCQCEPCRQYGREVAKKYFASRFDFVKSESGKHLLAKPKGDRP